jgi:hypothetical protein
LNFDCDWYLYPEGRISQPPAVGLDKHSTREVN